MKNRAFAAVFLALVSQAWADIAQLSDLDRQVIDFTKRHGHYMEPPTYPVDHPYWDELRWYRNLGSKVRPALMHLLTVEYEGDFRMMTDVVNCLATAEGDHSDIVAYVREKLPVMLHSDEVYAKSSYTNSCLYVLSKYGEPKDMDLIRSFFDYQDYVVTTTAKTQADNLQKRIDAGVFEKKEPRPERRPGRQEKTGDKSAGPVPLEEQERPAIKGEHKGDAPAWPWFTGGLAAILLLVWRMIRKRQ